MKIIIVGGVAGGASAAARMRRLDEHAEIILLERGQYISYANCGLPYYIGGEIQDRQELTLQTPESFHQRFRVDVRVCHEAIAVDPEGKTVRVQPEAGEPYTETYDKLILSPGAEPVIPPLEGVDNPRIFTLRTIPDTFRIKDFIDQNAPKSAVVVGGGAIGLEMAENLAARGMEVTVIEMADHLVAALDYDMACDLHQSLGVKGINLLLKTGVKSFETAEHGVFVKTESEKLYTDMVLLSVGVRPDTRIARQAGLQLNHRGAIVVNEKMETSHKDIYAAGDAVEVTHFVTGEKTQIPLAGPANKQGRIAADNCAGLDSAYQGSQGSSIIKAFDRVVAVTGLNEAAAQAAGISYDKVYSLSSSHAGYYPGASSISVKLLFEKGTGRVLGAQLIGAEGVDKRCDVIATAIRGNMTVTDLTNLDLCYAPPFSSAKDPVNMAGYIAENVMQGRVKQFYWHDVPEVRAKDNVTLLDVRTPGEYARGHIEGTIHIPLDELRDRLDELDSSKTLYVNCQSGLRSYLACRILSQRGFDCYNLAGGYRLYDLAARGQYDGNQHTTCGKAKD